MKRYVIGQLDVSDVPGALASFVKGRPIAGGGVSFRTEGEVSHPEPHGHDHEEIFVALSGRARLIVDGQESTFEAGDIIVIEPGEDHRYVVSPEGLVNLWFHVRE